MGPAQHDSNAQRWETLRLTLRLVNMCNLEGSCRLTQARPCSSVHTVPAAAAAAVSPVYPMSASQPPEQSAGVDAATAHQKVLQQQQQQ
jgi:hypothetical protein